MKAFDFNCFCLLSAILFPPFSFLLHPHGKSIKSLPAGPAKTTAFPAFKRLISNAFDGWPAPLQVLWWCCRVAASVRCCPVSGSGSRCSWREAKPKHGLKCQMAPAWESRSSSIFLKPELLALVESVIFPQGLSRLQREASQGGGGL